MTVVWPRSPLLVPEEAESSRARMSEGEWIRFVWGEIADELDTLPWDWPARWPHVTSIDVGRGGIVVHVDGIENIHFADVDVR